MATTFTNDKAKKAFLISLLLLLAYIVTLIFLGHPLPHRDDMLFLGTPIHAIQNGEFINPYCSGFLEQLGTWEHLYYMPGQVWLLFAWFKMVGISTLSLLFFQWMGYGIGMVSVYVVSTKKLNLNAATSILIAGLYLTVLIPMGLRPDAWGFGLAFAGLALINATNFKSMFIGIFIGGLGALCSPLSMAIFFPLALYLGLFGSNVKRFIPFIVAGLISFTLIVILFGLMIQFRFQTFFQIFQHHSSLQKDGLNSFVQFVQILQQQFNPVLKMPLFALAIGVGLIGLIKKSAPRLAIMAVLACLILSIALYAEKTVYVSGQIICWILLALGFQLFTTIKWRKVYGMCLCFLFLLSQSPYLIALFGQHNKAENTASILAQTQGYKYVVGDAVVARTIYDYKLPNNFKSLEFHAKEYFPKSIKDCPKDEIWIFSPQYTIILPQNGMVFPPKLTVMGKEFGSIPKNGFMLQSVKSNEPTYP